MKSNQKMRITEIEYPVQKVHKFEVTYGDKNFLCYLHKDGNYLMNGVYETQEDGTYNNIIDTNLGIEIKLRCDDYLNTYN